MNGIYRYWRLWALYCIIAVNTTYALQRKLVNTATRIERTMTMQVARDNHVKNLKEWFIGNYDNGKQSSKDLKRGRPTAKDGGHEFVSTCIRSHPSDKSKLVASFYLGEPVGTPFRFRLYEVLPDINGTYDAIMKLYKPSKLAEESLIRAQYDTKKYMPSVNEFEYIAGCNVGWTKSNWIMSLFRGGRTFYRGVLVNGTCQLPSQKDPSMLITVKDDLHLFTDALWVNDRVYAPDGTLIIGNTLNIPYKFEKLDS